MQRPGIIRAVREKVFLFFIAGPFNRIFLTACRAVRQFPGRRQCGIHAAVTAEQPSMAVLPGELEQAVRKNSIESQGV